jgi:acyl transferase domain-containing protein
MLFTQAIDTLNIQAAAVEAKIAQLQEQLSQIQSQIQAVKSVEQAAESAITQVRQALSGIRAIDESLEADFRSEVEACFSPTATPILLEAGDDEDEDLPPQPSPMDDAGDFVIAEAIGEIESVESEVESPQPVDGEQEILPDLRAWTIAELRATIAHLKLEAPKRATKIALIQELVRAFANKEVSKSSIVEALEVSKALK